MIRNFSGRFCGAYMSWIAAAAMSALSIGMIVMALFGQTVFARADDPNAIVTIDKFSFMPAPLTVTPGATVTFENRDDTVHSVVGVGGSFRSKALDTGDKFSFTFDKPGEYAYFCGLHPYMKGKVVVAP